jgi:hypothetical protein
MVKEAAFTAPTAQGQKRGGMHMFTKVIAILLTVVMMVSALVPPAVAQGPSSTTTATKIFEFTNSSFNVAWSPTPLVVNGTVEVTTTVTPTTLSVLTWSNNITVLDPNTGRLYIGQPAPAAPALEVQQSPKGSWAKDQPVNIQRREFAYATLSDSQKQPLQIEFEITILNGEAIAVNPVGSASGPIAGMPRPPSGTMTQNIKLTPFTVFNPNTKGNVVVSGSAKVTTSVFSIPNGTISTVVIAPNVTGVDQTTGAEYVGAGSFAQTWQFPDTVPALGSMSVEFVLSNTTAIDDVVEYGVLIGLAALIVSSTEGFDPATPPLPGTTP